MKMTNEYVDLIFKIIVILLLSSIAYFCFWIYQIQAEEFKLHILGLEAASKIKLPFE